MQLMKVLIRNILNQSLISISLFPKFLLLLLAYILEFKINWRNPFVRKMLEHWHTLMKNILSNSVGSYKLIFKYTLHTILFSISISYSFMVQYEYPSCLSFRQYGTILGNALEISCFPKVSYHLYYVPSIQMKNQRIVRC